MAMVGGVSLLLSLGLKVPQSLIDANNQSSNSSNKMMTVEKTARHLKSFLIQHYIFFQKLIEIKTFVCKFVKMLDLFLKDK